MQDKYLNFSVGREVAEKLKKYTNKLRDMACPPIMVWSHTVFLQEGRPYNLLLPGSKTKAEPRESAGKLV